MRFICRLSLLSRRMDRIGDWLNGVFGHGRAHFNGADVPVHLRLITSSPTPNTRTIGHRRERAL